jgi:hypothetical protein
MLLQPAIQMAAMLAMVAHKSSDMHHARSISHKQRKEYFGMYFTLQRSVPDPKSLFLECHQML